MRKALEELVAKERESIEVDKQKFAEMNMRLQSGATITVESTSGYKDPREALLEKLEALLLAPLTGAKGCCLACGAARETTEEPVSLGLDENQLREVLSHCIYDPIDFPLAVQKLNAKLRRALNREEERKSD